MAEPMRAASPADEPRPAPGFTLITGLSGAGRSEAAHSPRGPRATSWSTTCRRRCWRRWRSWLTTGRARTGGHRGRRPGRRVLRRAFEGARGAQAGSVAYRILFLEAADDDLVNRYEATRRRHPLAPADRVVEGIRKERLMMETLAGDADLIIDTSRPHPARPARPDPGGVRRGAARAGLQVC